MEAEAAQATEGMPMQYIVTVNPRNRVHVSQHPELAICLRWASLLVCERIGCQQGWYRAGHYSLSSLEYRDDRLFLLSWKRSMRMELRLATNNIEWKRNEQEQ